MQCIRSLTFVLLCIIAAVSQCKTATGPSHDKKVVCFVLTHTDLIGKSSEFQYDKVDWNLCTHAIASAYSRDPTDMDPDLVKNDYDLLTKIRKEYPHLKIFSSIRRSLRSDYTKIGKDWTYRQKFIQNLYNFTMKYKLNGINLQLDDLEEVVLAPIEFKSMMPFMKDLKDRFDQSNLSLSVTFAVTPRFDYDMYNYTILSENVEFLSFSINFNPVAIGHKTYHMGDAILMFKPSKILQIYEKLIESGVLPEKIVAALDFKGNGFNYYGPGHYTYSKIYEYNAICTWSKTYTESGVTAFDKDEITVVTDDSRSMANKVRSAIQRGLGGVAAIDITSDDFNSMCNIDADTFKDFKDDISLDVTEHIDFPLLRVVNKAIDVTLDELAGKVVSIVSITTPKVPTLNQDADNSTQDTTSTSVEAITTVPDSTQDDGNGTASHFISNIYWMIFTILISPLIYI